MNKPQAIIHIFEQHDIDNVCPSIAQINQEATKFLFYCSEKHNIDICLEEIKFDYCGTLMFNTDVENPNFKQEMEAYNKWLADKEAEKESKKRNAELLNFKNSENSKRRALRIAQRIQVIMNSQPQDLVGALEKAKLLPHLLAEKE